MENRLPISESNSNALIIRLNSNPASVIVKNLRSLKTEFEAAHESLKAEKLKNAKHTEEKRQLKFRLGYLDLQQSVERSRTVDLEAKVLKLENLSQQNALNYAELQKNQMDHATLKTIVQDLESLHILDPQDTSQCKSKRRKLGFADFSAVVQVGEAENSQTMMEILKEANINLRKKNVELEFQIERFQLHGPRTYFELEIEEKSFRVKCEASDYSQLVEIRECLDQAFQELVEEVSEWRTAKECSDRNLIEVTEKFKLEIATLRLDNVKLKNQLLQSSKGFPMQDKPNESFLHGEIGCGDATTSWFPDFDSGFELIDLRDEPLPSEIIKNEVSVIEAEKQEPGSKGIPRDKFELESSSESMSNSTGSSTPCETDDEVSSLLPVIKPSFLKRMRKMIPKKVKSSKESFHNYFTS